MNGLDRSGNIPATKLPSPGNMSELPSGWQHIRRLLVVRLDNIGDMVLLTPALRVLRQALPQAVITLMASPTGSQVVPLLPWVDQMITQRVVWQSWGGFDSPGAVYEMALIKHLQVAQFDAAIIFTSFAQSPYPPAFVCYLAGIPVRVGQSKEFGGEVLTHWVKPLADETHQAERNLFMLAEMGFVITNRQLELVVPPQVQARADNLLEKVGLAPQQPFIALAPGAGCAARRYDPARFARVATQLTAAANRPIIVLGDKREKGLVEPIVAQGPASNIHSLVGLTTLPETAAIIRRASLLIGNDSSAMHLADAFQTPMVILFSGSEHESQWCPRQTPAILLRQSTPCSPCYAFTCPYEMECLDIAPEKVVAAAMSMLGRAAAKPHPIPSGNHGDSVSFTPRSLLTPTPQPLLRDPV
ncbi:MAG: glycosyltransferase family 9 protein [Chloroflexi bacterium]|nr:glycosyltransferase family 9 protein [Chloroflexota bacterium]